MYGGPHPVWLSGKQYLSTYGTDDVDDGKFLGHTKSQITEVPSLYVPSHCTDPHGSRFQFLYNEEIKGSVNRILIHESRCNERLRGKPEGSTRLTYTGLSRSVLWKMMCLLTLVLNTFVKRENKPHF